MKKIFFVCIFFALLSGAVSAVVINSPAELPANLNWSFSVDLDSSDSFSETKILFDEKPVVTAYSNGSVISDPYNGQFVLKAFVLDTDPATTAGLKLFVSMIGLDNGNHTIQAVTSENSAVKASVQTGVSTFVPLSDNYSAKISTDLDVVSKSLEELKSNQQLLDSSNSAALEESQKKIKILEALIEELQLTQSKQLAQLNQVEEAQKNNSISIPFFGESKQQTETVENNSNSTGFSLLDSAPLLGLAIVIIIVAFLLFNYFKGRREEVSLDDLKGSLEGKKDLSDFTDTGSSTIDLPKIPLGKLIRRKDD